MTTSRGRRGRIDVPSRSDPLLRLLVEGIGGPLGRHADPGRVAPGWFTVQRVLILMTLVSAVLAVLVKNPCRVAGFTSPDYFYRACYSDWPELFTSRGFGEGSLPFVVPGTLFEYPVLLGLLASGTAFLVNLLPLDGTSPGAALLYFDLNTVLVVGVWIIITLTTARLAPSRPWDAAIVATAPVVILSVTVNWDLWAVLLATLGMLALARDRPVLAGVLWGLGAALKVYPVLLLGIVLLTAVRSGRYRPFLLTATGAVIAWLAVNVPILLRDPAGWQYFLTFSETRSAGFSSGWYVYDAMAERLGVDGLPSGVVNAGALGLFATGCVLIAVLVLRAERTPRTAQVALLIVGAFVLCNKVYSPQYALWLVPLIALAVPRWRVVLLWQLAEVLHWWAVWLYLGGQVSGGPPEHNLGLGIYAAAVLLHIAATAYVLGWVVQDIRFPDGDVVRRTADDTGVDDGSASTPDPGAPGTSRAGVPPIGWQHARSPGHPRALPAGGDLPETAGQ